MYWASVNEKKQIKIKKHQKNYCVIREEHGILLNVALTTATKQTKSTAKTTKKKS
ncbi:hypothetical protein ACFFGV_18760 [Pontibacillus salicampi]|uniref:Uncharacterized protein n=1 Tax=Pontibacillus salicampi TaxID=1449801 RepID=A0ABV6LT82_9BACI